MMPNPPWSEQIPGTPHHKGSGAEPSHVPIAAERADEALLLEKTPLSALSQCLHTQYSSPAAFTEQKSLNQGS